MIIEFMGTSGSGKSTLIPCLIQILREDGLTAMPATEAILYYMRRTYFGRLICALMPPSLQEPALRGMFGFLLSHLYVVRFVASYPRLAIFVVKLQFHRHIPGRHKWLILRLFFEMASWYQFLQRQQTNEVVVFDEGFAHRVTHLFVSEVEQPDGNRILAYLKLLPQSDLVIWVQAPLETCLNRIHARGLQVRLRGRSEQDISQFMLCAEQIVGLAAHYLAEGGWQLAKVENKGDLAACVAELRQVVLAYVPQIASTSGQILCES